MRSRPLQDRIVAAVCERLTIATLRSLRWFAPPVAMLLAPGAAEAACNPGVSCRANAGEVLILPSTANPSLSYTTGTQTLVARGAGASITATGIAFTATTNTVIAGATTLPGTIILNGGTVIATSGGGGTAAIQQQGQGLLTATDTTVRAGGIAGDAAIRHTVSAVNPMTLTRVQVRIDATGVTGLDADSPAASLIANDVRITTTGNNADGVHGDGRLTMSGGSITTSGSASRGLFASGANADFTATGVSVTTSGASAYGSALSGGGTLTMMGGSITTTGADAHALRSSSGTNTATIENSTLTAAQGSGIYVTGGRLDATVTGSSVAGDPALLEVVNSGSLDLTADASTLNGTALTAAAGWPAPGAGATIPSRASLRLGCVPIIGMSLRATPRPPFRQ